MQYNVYFDVLICIALCFTAIVTPFEVAVLEASLNSLFAINCFVDTLYLLDMVRHVHSCFKVNLNPRTVGSAILPCVQKPMVEMFVMVCTICPVAINHVAPSFMVISILSHLPGQDPRCGIHNLEDLEALFAHMVPA
jgi:hypothetical protein